MRSNPVSGYTKIPHSLSRDPRLTNGARGLLVQLLSHADGFRSDEEFLAACSADSRNEVRKQLALLKQLGYLVRERIRDEHGHLTIRSVVYDTPQKADEPPSPPDPETPSRQVPARRSEQAEQHIAAGGTVSPGVGAHIEDQKKIKKISQSAAEQEAARWLRSEYGDGLTDYVVASVIAVARDRAARAGRPIDDLVPYLKGMRKPGTGGGEADLGDVIGAAMDAEDARRPMPEEPAENQPAEEPFRFADPSLNPAVGIEETLNPAPAADPGDDPYVRGPAYARELLGRRRAVND